MVEHPRTPCRPSLSMPRFILFNRLGNISSHYAIILDYRQRSSSLAVTRYFPRFVVAHTGLAVLGDEFSIATAYAFQSV